MEKTKRDTNIEAYHSESALPGVTFFVGLIYRRLGGVKNSDNDIGLMCWTLFSN